MEWIPLIAASLRLVDLHDSDRAYGSPSNFTRESRTGNSDGVYLDIAFHVIHRLKLLDQSASQDYLPFSSILSAIKDDRPDVAEVDVQYVLNVLRRPSELFYLTSIAGHESKACHSEKRETALIEKTDYADEYRLSASGRMLLSLANVARDATYLRGDAYNLLHAIEWNDFPKILKLTPFHGHLIVLAEGVQIEQTPYPQAAVFGAISWANDRAGSSGQKAWRTGP